MPVLQSYEPTISRCVFAEEGLAALLTTRGSGFIDSGGLSGASRKLRDEIDCLID